jgi:hypothetical protein
MVAVVGIVVAAVAFDASGEPRTKIDAQQCKQWASHKSNLGKPLMFTMGSSYTAVLFVDRQNKYTFFCSFEPSGDYTSDAQPGPAWFNDFFGAVAPNGLNVNCQYADIGEMYGPVGAEVTGATFEFAGQPSVHAIVKRGFYLALWLPASASPNRITVTLKSGRMQSIGANLPQPIPGSGMTC